MSSSIITHQINNKPIISPYKRQIRQESQLSIRKDQGEQSFNANQSFNGNQPQHNSIYYVFLQNNLDFKEDLNILTQNDKILNQQSPYKKEQTSPEKTHKDIDTLEFQNALLSSQVYEITRTADSLKEKIFELEQTNLENLSKQLEVKELKFLQTELANVNSVLIKRDEQLASNKLQIAEMDLQLKAYITTNTENKQLRNTNMLQKQQYYIKGQIQHGL